MDMWKTLTKQLKFYDFFLFRNSLSSNSIINLETVTGKAFSIFFSNLISLKLHFQTTHMAFLLLLMKTFLCRPFALLIPVFLPLFRYLFTIHLAIKSNWITALWKAKRKSELDPPNRFLSILHLLCIQLIDISNT